MWALEQITHLRLARPQPSCHHPRHHHQQQQQPQIHQPAPQGVQPQNCTKCRLINSTNFETSVESIFYGEKCVLV